nr:hypothetical protein Iba_chr12bCG14850 [Ipomoea batatas]
MSRVKGDGLRISVPGGKKERWRSSSSLPAERGSGRRGGSPLSARPRTEAGNGGSSSVNPCRIHVSTSHVRRQATVCGAVLGSSPSKWRGLIPLSKSLSFGVKKKQQTFDVERWWRQQRKLAADLFVHSSSRFQEVSSTFVSSPSLFLAVTPGNDGSRRQRWSFRQCSGIKQRKKSVVRRKAGRCKQRRGLTELLPPSNASGGSGGVPHSPAKDRTAATMKLRQQARRVVAVQRAATGVGGGVKQPASTEQLRSPTFPVSFSVTSKWRRNDDLRSWFLEAAVEGSVGPVAGSVKGSGPGGATFSGSMARNSSQSLDIAPASKRPHASSLAPLTSSTPPPALCQQTETE